jgi:hypothetical protein
LLFGASVATIHVHSGFFPVPYPDLVSRLPVTGATPSSPRWKRFVPRLACLIACLAFLFHACLWIPRLTYGFAMYYTYARLALVGETLDRVYDDAYFNGKVREFGFDLHDEPNNPPTAALAYMPVAWLQPVWAKIVWSAASLAALGYALKVLFEISGIRASGNTGLWLLTLVFLWRPAYDTIAFGQVYFLLLLLFVLSMKELMRKRAAGTAAPLTLALLLKGYGLTPVLLLAFRRRWKEVGIVVSFSAIIIIATLPLFGTISWLAFISTVLPSLGRLPPHAHVAYQTINGLLRHLFTYDPVWLPHPVLELPGFLVTLLSYGISITLVLLVLLRTSLVSGPDKFLSFGAALGVGVVTAPLAEEYHFVLFIPLIFALAARFDAPGSSGYWKGFSKLIPAMAVLVMAAPINYKGLQYASFPAVLMAYPKLYAGLAILWYARVVMKRRDPDVAGEAR